MPLPIAIETFISEVRTQLGAEISNGFKEAFDAMDIEGDYNNHAGAFPAAVECIVRDRERSLLERLEMIERVRSLKGHNEINMRKFTGWQ